MRNTSGFDQIGKKIERNGLIIKIIDGDGCVHAYACVRACVRVCVCVGCDHDHTRTRVKTNFYVPVNERQSVEALQLSSALFQQRHNYPEVVEEVAPLLTSMQRELLGQKLSAAVLTARHRKEPP